MTKRLQYVELMNQARIAESVNEKRKAIMAFKLWQDKYEINYAHPASLHFYAALVPQCEQEEMVGQVRDVPKMPTPPPVRELHDPSFTEDVARCWVFVKGKLGL